MPRNRFLDQPAFSADSRCPVNAFNPKRPEPHEDDRIGDVIVPADELQRMYEERRKEQIRLARRDRIKRLTNGGATLLLLAVVGAQAVAIATMLPLQKPVP